MKIMYFVWSIWGLIAGVSLYLVFTVGPMANNVTSIATGVLATIIVMGAQLLNNYKKSIPIVFKSKFKYRNTFVRVSVSHLFRIKLDGKYLLILGNRIPQYQPVGGVVKKYDDSNDVMRKLDVRDDDFFPIDSTSKDDLRVRVKGKHLIHFLEWYDSGTGREISAEREFYEELVASGYLNASLFPFLKYKFVKRIQEDIVVDKFVGGPQILISDIYEIILDDRQKNEILSLVQNNNHQFMLADEDEISRLGGGKTRLPIARTSEWLL